jgi:hypothetical protein
LAVTVFGVFMVTVQVVPFVASQPSQPVKMERKPGVAVSVTTVPLLKSAEQVDPQAIPAGLDVTVPPRRPVLVTVKGTVNVKLLALSAVPAGVVTPRGPVVAPAGTVAWIAVSEVTVNVAALPLNVTAVAPMKFAPLIVTLVPTRPLEGVKLVMVGATAKLLALVAVPAGVVTLRGPVVAPAGTVAWIAVLEVTVKLAALPLNVTAVAPMKFVPPIVTLVPTGPLPGAKVVIVGATPIKNALRMFAVVCWMRGSTRFTTLLKLSSAQLHWTVPAPNTQAPLGAW